MCVLSQCRDHAVMLFGEVFAVIPANISANLLGHCLEANGEHVSLLFTPSFRVTICQLDLIDDYTCQYVI